MKYGLLGKKLGHSYSKIIHGFLGNPDYELLELPPEEIGPFMGRMDFSGINVTIPYKETVIPYCVLDEAAKKIGSVNTVLNRGGVLYGFNTDYFGFGKMAERAGISFHGKKVVILGSGGTSKTAACVAKDGGAREVTVVSRGGKDNYGNLENHFNCDVLINTTPVGMYPNNGGAPVSLTGFANLSAVIDVIYNPLRTKLLLDARELGIPAAGGLAMLTAQAVKAHEIFFELSAETKNCSQNLNAKPAAHGQESVSLDKIISKTEKYFSNIVLIGMPGCGKTTIGKELAKLTGKNFTDTDERIEERTGRKIPEIIQTEGEPFFRELEREVIAEVSAQAGQVIATGGGSVLLKENREALRQNGGVVFLERELGKLATNGRPLSVDLEALYQKRLPLYESARDYKITVADNLNENLRRLLTEYPQSATCGSNGCFHRA